MERKVVITGLSLPVAWNQPDLVGGLCLGLTGGWIGLSVGA